jgi:hypothetical protein
MEISPGSMSLQMQPRVWEPNFAAPWKGGEIGRAREDRFLPRPLWGAETHLQITWGCARNLACPRLPSLAPPELKDLSSFSISMRSTASSEESTTGAFPNLSKLIAAGVSCGSGKRP